MKKLLVLVLVLLLTLGSTAYAAVELEMNYWMSEQDEGILPAIEAFNASQDEIVVNASSIPWSQYWDKLVVGLPAGSAPDVFTINALNVVDYARNGYLLDITDLFESGAVDVTKYPAHTVATHTVDGVLRGIPRDFDAIAVYYNKTLFDEAGVEYPKDGWTWDEFIETAKKLTNPDAGIHGCSIAANGQAFGYDYIYGNGGMLFDENGMYVVNTPENAEAFQKLHDAIHVEKISATVEEQVEIAKNIRFLSGTDAMVFDGSWNMATYQEAYSDMLGVVSLPIMKEATTISHSLSWVDAATTKHSEEVKKFLTYLAGYEAQAQAAQAVIPAYEGTPELWAAKFADYNTDAFLGPIASGAAHPLPAANKNVQQIFARFNEYMTEMLSTGDIEANLAAMEAEFNELLK